MGRSPNLNRLNLEAAGIEYHAKGVTVDETLRTTNPNVYASGDIAEVPVHPHRRRHLAHGVAERTFSQGRKRSSTI
ncbi:MAG: FAD-dependent oxidoreductase [Caldilineaceae bacterium]